MHVKKKHTKNKNVNNGLKTWFQRESLAVLDNYHVFVSDCFENNGRTIGLFISISK